MLADTPRVNQHCWALSLQPEGNLLAVSVGGIFGSQVRIWDRDCHEFVKMWDFDSGRTFSEFVDKHTLLIATSNHEIQLVDIRDYSVIKEG